jgi:hypothetical protein
LRVPLVQEGQGLPELAPRGAKNGCGLQHVQLDRASSHGFPPARFDLERHTRTTARAHGTSGRPTAA